MESHPLLRTAGARLRTESRRLIAKSRDSLVDTFIEELYPAFDRLPRVVPPRHVSRVEPGLSQRSRALAPNVEAVHAEGHNGLVLRQGADPLVDALGIPPDSAVDDVLRPRAVVTRPGIDDLDTLTGVQQLLNLFRRDGWQVAELRLLEPSRRRHTRGIGVPRFDRLPVDIAHEGRNIGGRVRAEVDVVSVLVHVEGEDRNATGNALRVIRGTLIYQTTVARHIRQKYPATVPGQALAQRDEFATPALNRPEITGDGVRDGFERCPPIPAEAREIQLMKQRRVEQGRLLPTEATDDRGRHCRDIERLQLARERVQAIESSSVVVLVVAFDELRRHAIQRPRAAEKGGDAILHRKPPFEIEKMLGQWNLTPCYGQRGCRRPHTTQPVRRGCSARRSRVPATPWQRGTRPRSRRRNRRTPALRVRAERTTRPLVPDLARPRSASYRGLPTRSSSVARPRPGTAVRLA